VLALLAFACLPTLAQAETVYETETPTIPGETVGPGHKNNSPHESSKDAEASGTPNPGGGSEGPGTGSGEKSGTKGTNPSTPDGGGSGQGSPGNGSTGERKQGGKVLEAKPVSSQTESDNSSSSPLVPILIAVAVLAAITIGAVVLRQRRQRGEPGGQVSPRAS
jgi:cobalamin biosynthesis Mg chelatase CobN